jgi:hypothetical protein
MVRCPTRTPHRFRSGDRRRGIVGFVLESRLVNAIWPGHPSRWRDVPARLLPFGVWVLRLSIAAVVAYLLTRPFARTHVVDLTGPLTALLVLQASTLSTLKMGLVRVAAVLSGVLIAILLATWSGLTWWSLGAAIASSLLVARLLRLGEQMLEAPISAMLILGVTQHDVAAYIRVINTFIGAGVGIAFGLVLPTALASTTVVRQLRRVAETTAAPLDRAADGLQERTPTRDQAQGWRPGMRPARLRRSAARCPTCASAGAGTRGRSAQPMWCRY